MLWFCTRYPVEQGLKQFRGELENCSAIRTIFLLYFNLKTKTKNESPETLIDDNFRQSGETPRRTGLVVVVFLAA